MDTKTISTTDGGTVLAAHSRWVRTVILARTGESAAVDDVFQEVALALSRQSSQHKTVGRIEPFLYRLAVRQSLLYRRRAGRLRRLKLRLIQQDAGVTDVGSDPGEWLLKAELRQTVREALQTLVSKDQEILLLKYTEDWSYLELATHLGISVSAVEARLHRARQRLRDRLIQTSANEAIR